METMQALIIVGAVTGPLALLVALIALVRTGSIRRDINEPTIGVSTIQPTLTESTITPATAQTSPLSADVSDRVRQLVASGQKISAIKVLREESGLGLKDAKAAVDRLG